MELMQCFEQGCKREVMYACPCDSPKILTCQKHCGKHLAQPNKAHTIEWIFVEPCKGTKEAILGFFAKEQSKNSKLKEKILASFSQRLIESKNDIKGLLQDLDSDSTELSNYFTKISQIQKLSKSEQDPIIGLLSLQPDEAIEKLKKFIPANRELYSSARLFCGLNEKVEKMIGHFIEDKFETYLNARLSSIENTFEEHNKSTISSNEKVEALNKRFFSIENTLEEHNKAINSSNNKLDILNTRFSNIENTLEEYNKSSNSSNNKFEDISKRLSNIENIFEEHNKAIKSSNGKFDILNKRLSNIENTLEEHNKSTNSNNEKFEEISKRFYNIENTLEEYNKATNSSNNKFEGLSKRFSNIENTLEGHNKAINSNNDEHKKIIESMGNEIANIKDTISNLINENKKSCKNLENLKEEINSKMKNEIDQTHSQIINLNQDLQKTNEFLNSQKLLKELKDKRLEILNKQNDPQLEKEFRQNCSIYQSHTCINDPSIQKAYQDYNLAYCQNASLYSIIQRNNNKNHLFIYDTERESMEIRVLETPESLDKYTCIARLPGGNLFCFGNYNDSGIYFIIDKNYRIQYLPSGTPYIHSSSIYFNKSVYCFGGHNDDGYLTLSERFDLNKKQWIKLKPLPKADDSCTNIIFNENILISGMRNKNLLRYSIVRNTFVTIPYDFAKRKKKILINSERLYLIECEYDGSVYESEVSNDSVWRRIGDSIIPIFNQVYLIYNKGAINIAHCDYNDIKYFKFNLKEKTLERLDESKLFNA